MRQFYIIGHNPNTVSDAINYLQAGANALEPDIHSINGVYYMGEGTTSTDLTLVDYLQTLVLTLQTTPALTLALIMFDTKNSNGSIAVLFDCIQTNFSNQFPGTAIMVTRSQAQEDEFVFFGPAATILPPNWAVGVDEHTDPFTADPFFKTLAIPNYTYADGISILAPLLAGLFKQNIEKAITMRDAGNSFKLVYSWTLDSPSDIQTFLNLNPDGLITDSPAALNEIITTNFSAQYQLAQVGYNPFA
jgi:hypothetical protein